MAGKRTGTAVGAHRLWNYKLESRHETDLGPMHVSDSCVAWSFVGPLPVGQAPVLESEADSLDTILYSGMLRPVIMQGGGAWNCLNLINML